jgi:hypothetical protein
MTLVVTDGAVRLYSCDQLMAFASGRRSSRSNQARPQALELPTKVGEQALEITELMDDPLLMDRLSSLV